ncbi:hypothetical protein CTL2C_814 [Chlamydia trachomatis L2c]|nr:hypothetical protein CTL2C_814 [Chlamydia trachomatis L2c]
MFSLGAVLSSTSVFHWRHPEHCPNHFGECVPHSVHVHCVLIFVVMC